jgi:hypothetical protein
MMPGGGGFLAGFVPAADARETTVVDEVVAAGCPEESDGVAHAPRARLRRPSNRSRMRIADDPTRAAGRHRTPLIWWLDAAPAIMPATRLHISLIAYMLN